MMPSNSAEMPTQQAKPTGFNRLFYGAAGLAATLLCAFVAPPAHANEDADLFDFMVMNVCVDGSDQAIPGLSPISPDCKRQRDIRESDAVPYHLTSFGQDAIKCPGHVTVNDNLPVTRNGVVRVVKTVRVDYQNCRPKNAPVPAYYSVRWFDDQFAFIMGAWSRGKDGGKVGGGITPQCEAAGDTSRTTSRRYFRNWVLFDRATAASGKTGFEAFSKASAIHGLPALDSACPAEYRARYLAVWTRGQYTYRSGATLETLISHPYSQSDATGTTPAGGKQMERTYWTREFGQSRWENWKRDDYTNKKSGETAVELAKATFSSGECGKPFAMVSEPTPGITLGPIEENGTYSQTLTDRRTGQTHRWYMAGCQDITNVVQPQNKNGDPYPDFSVINPKFWEFWSG
ncbi:hypothetical protein IFT84_07995 [Rhizobium sp. CFBP 8762]|uniref:hypothetical protein n=1 Tax=Rhizobium sp. CFBP 8762 TaxID=2775279 RepID=UPI001784A17B|nr:hypothetical protein [Rhizobium sp. CFBP 8762]MBD8554470.1 hypothetical protein [Rhizobium sp. CFBP 8762]